MTRICCVTHHYYPQHAHIRRDLETLLEAGYGVDIICLKRKGQKYRETINGVNVYRMPVEHKRRGLLRQLIEYSMFFIMATITLGFLQLRRGYALIEVTNMPDILVFCSILPKLLGAKITLYIFDNVPEYFSFVYRLGPDHIAIRLLRWCERISTAYADHVIVTQSVAKRVLESHGVPASKMSVVLNGPNEGKFLPVATNEHAKKCGRFRLITHGSIIRCYGIQTTVRSIPLLLDRIPELEVEVAGEGEYLDELRKLARDLGVEEHVRFTGHVPHEAIPRMISEADVGVVSMLTDLMLPTKLLEYVAMAKPVVIAAQPTMKEYFDNDSALFYKPDDEHDLARCILEVYSQPTKAASRVSRALAQYEGYRWSHMKQVYLKVYESLLH